MIISRKDHYHFNIEFRPEEVQTLLTLDDVEDSDRDAQASDIQSRLLFHILTCMGKPDLANNMLRSPEIRTSNLA